MYLTASRPPRVAGARPSSRSSARYLRWASAAAVLTGGSAGLAGVGVSSGRDARQPSDRITTTTGHLQDITGAPVVEGAGAGAGPSRAAQGVDRRAGALPA